MGVLIPPPPHGKDESVQQDWFVRVRNAINKLGSDITWSLLDKSGSNITDIVTRRHIDLQSTQGGNSTEAYHLTSAQLSGLIGGTNTTLHTHVGSSYTDENAQDAVGAMVNGTLIYTDSTPSLGVNIGTIAGTVAAGDDSRFGTEYTPATSSTSGTKGMICWDASYFYICTAPNTWKRAALSTW